MSELPHNQLLVGDATTVLATLPAASVDCVVTSPPYYRLRDYQAAGQLGHEPSVSGWVDGLTSVFEQIRRVLKPTGTVWLNVADTYSRHRRQGARRKSLLLGPERLVLHLAQAGWVVRNKIIWAKTNPMPHSVKDRLTATWEHLFLLTINETGYWFDLDAIRIPHTTTTKPGNAKMWTGSYGGTNNGLVKLRLRGLTGHPNGKNPGDVWQLAKAAHRGEHSATYPDALIQQPILAGCPRHVCPKCGKPFHLDDTPPCVCDAGRRPGVVLDPFIGTGTTAHVAAGLDRNWLGIDLTDRYFQPPQQVQRSVA